jgi:hypothetical protein
VSASAVSGCSGSDAPSNRRKSPSELLARSWPAVPSTSPTHCGYTQERSSNRVAATSAATPDGSSNDNTTHAALPPRSRSARAARTGPHSTAGRARWARLRGPPPHPRCRHRSRRALKPVHTRAGSTSNRAVQPAKRDAIMGMVRLLGVVSWPHRGGSSSTPRQRYTAPIPGGENRGAPIATARSSRPSPSTSATSSDPTAENGASPVHGRTSSACPSRTSRAAAGRDGAAPPHAPLRPPRAGSGRRRRRRRGRRSRPPRIVRSGSSKVVITSASQPAAGVEDRGATQEALPVEQVGGSVPVAVAGPEAPGPELTTGRRTPSERAVRVSQVGPGILETPPRRAMPRRGRHGAPPRSRGAHEQRERRLLPHGRVRPVRPLPHARLQGPPVDRPAGGPPGPGPRGGAHRGHEVGSPHLQRRRPQRRHAQRVQGTAARSRSWTGRASATTAVSSSCPVRTRSTGA